MLVGKHQQLYHKFLGSHTYQYFSIKRYLKTTLLSIIWVLHQSNTKGQVSTALSHIFCMLQEQIVLQKDKC